jgi:hypothetical protein
MPFSLGKATSARLRSSRPSVVERRIGHDRHAAAAQPGPQVRIDRFHARAPQAGLAGAAHGFARCVVRAHLADEEDLVALSGDGLAHY